MIMDCDVNTYEVHPDFEKQREGIYAEELSADNIHKMVLNPEWTEIVRSSIRSMFSDVSISAISAQLTWNYRHLYDQPTGRSGELTDHIYGPSNIEAYLVHWPGKWELNIRGGWVAHGEAPMNNSYDRKGPTIGLHFSANERGEFDLSAIKQAIAYAYVELSR
jgi:hypothetical protein